MTDILDRLSQMSPKRLALLALELQEQLEAAGRSTPEPVAIIGMGCRLPGAADPDAYWRLLRDGVDAISEVPKDRWDADAYYDPDPDTPGKIATRWGGFLDDVDRFEPQIFGITPREARSLDPQQRLLLEVGWETLEHAGIAPDSVQGSPTGVFVGVCNLDYGQLLLESGGDDLDMYVSTGNAGSVASGRLSYVLGLRGPAMTVDTACSSSLVAVHLAAQAVREGQCSMALAGGVNVILSPKTTMTLSRAKMMASDGRCKAFDAAGDGFVRGEGCGLVLLKRLSDAVADGDRVLAVIRGTATNQDGRSNGLTAPNGPSQVAVIRSAIADAGIEPGDVQYVETHGTGTSLGDPIEAQALGAALGAGRDGANRLRIGSAKTNLGHLESAAGVAGLLKVVLSLQHGELPPSLHFEVPSPHIPWDRLPIDVVTERTTWPSGDRPRLAGVSSFGFSGSNAHIIVEEAPAGTQTDRSATPAADRPVHVLELAASGEDGLRELVARYVEILGQPDVAALADIAHSANTGRADLVHRLAVVADDAAGARRELEGYLDGDRSDRVVTGVAPSTRVPEVAFLFTGHGAQYAGMGRTLYETQPVFREAIDRCAELLVAEMDRPLLDVLWSTDPDPELGVPLLESMAYAQPALFAVEYALARLWDSWGIRPDVVAGHSAGEYVAAVVAGVIDVADGIKLIAARGRLMASLPPDGEMATVFATEERVRRALAAGGADVSIAAINGTESIALSGTGGKLSIVLDELRADGIEVRPLAIPVAAHSPQVDPILDDFESVARTVEFRQPRLDVVSGMTGRLAEGDDLVTANYWRRHLREPVRFADAFGAVHDRGTRIFVEIGPHPTLLNIGRHIVPEHECAWLPSLRSGRDEWPQILHSLAELYVRGLPVDWRGFDAPYGRERVALPTYPFRRERYWIESSRRARSSHGEHRLLGRRLESPALDAVVFETEIGATWPQFLDHHRIFGQAILPSPVYIEMASAAGERVLGPGELELRNLVIREAMLLPEDDERVVQLVMTPMGESTRVEFHTRERAGSGWTVHASAELLSAGPADEAATLSRDEVLARCDEHIDGATYYGRLAEFGLEFGTGFRGVAELWRRDGEALGRVVLPESLGHEAGAYGFHPALLDACFHVLGAPLVHDETAGAYLLTGIDRFRVHRPPGRELWNHTVLRDGFDDARDAFVGDIRLFDADGRLVAEALGLNLRRATRDAMMRVARHYAPDWLYGIDWHELPARAGTGPTAVVGDLATSLSGLASEFDAAGYERSMAELEAVARADIDRAFLEVSAGIAPSERLTTAELTERCGVVPRHHRLFAHLLEGIADRGMLRRTDGGWDVLAADPVARPPVAADASPEAALLARCGRELGPVLRGEADPLDLLFPGGSHADAEAIYTASAPARMLNELVADATEVIATDLAGVRPLRVLEIGAGTGSTTNAVLARLADAGSEYWFTDIAPTFVARAEERHAGSGAIRTAVFDVERSPADQGVPTGYFDVVIAVNVLHATSDLGVSLQHARELLAPSGTLLAVEGVRPSAWTDITFGLTDGWWRFGDTARREGYPLLDRDRWLEVLDGSGFADASSISGAAEDAPGQILLLARHAGDEATAAEAAPRPWIVIGDGRGLGDALAARLASDDRPVSVLPADLPVDALRASIDAAAERVAPIVVHVGAIDIAPMSGSTVEAMGASTAAVTGEVLRTAQALVASAADAELWLVTRGAQPASDTVEAPEQATIWGLGRVVGLEHPEIWGGVIDLDPDAAGSGAGAADQPIADVDVAAIIAHVDDLGDEDQIAVRGERSLVPRVVRRGELQPTVVDWRRDGSYLITGGLGGLGLELARWMARRGAGSIVLTGRTGLPDRSTWSALPAGRTSDQVAAIAEIEALGASVTVVAADVADRAAMAALVDRFGDDLPPLCGVVHAAAALSNWTIADMPVEALAEMLRPKVDGTRLLAELTAGIELDFFVLFSSTTSLWGSRELGHYAAANQFLDSFAFHRRTTGLPATAIDWGTWAEMRVASAEEQAVVVGSGLHPMPTEAALEAFGDIVGSTDEAQVVAAAVDWGVLKATYEARRPRPLLALVDDIRPQRARVAAGEVPELAALLDGAAAHERRPIVIGFLRDEVGRAVGAVSPVEVDVDQGLFEMGMDSLMSVELKGRIEVAVGRNLPSTLTFNYPNVSALADYLLSEVLPSDAGAAPDGDAPVDATAAPTPPDDGAPRADATTQATDAMSEDELADQLASRLAKLRKGPAS